MASTTTRFSASRVQQPRRLFTISIGIILALSVVIALSIPATRRFLANPTATPAVSGISSIDVTGDWFQNHRYAPAVVQVPVGSTITWNFVDRGANGSGELVEHNVIGDGWGSPLLANGSWQHTFTQTGRYRYVCTLHPGMDGVVEVVAQ